MSIEVTIIIPVYNEERYLARCLDSIVQQDYAKEKLEVILIDGDSTDRTREIIDSYKKHYHFITMIENKDRITSKAMNLGIKAAKGNIVIITSAHAILCSDYLTRCIDSLKTSNAVCVGGRIITLPGHNTKIAQAISLATANIFGVGNSRFRISSKAGYVDTVPFGAYHKEIFDKIGLFNESLIRNQDIELNARILQNGGKIYLDSEINSYYYNRSTLRDLWQQNFKNGLWNIYTIVVNPRSLSIRHFVPFAFVLFLMLSVIMSFFSSLGIIAFIFILTTYLLLSLIFSIHLGVTNELKLIPLFPAVYWVLHVSYGLGSLWGLLNVRNLIKENKTEISGLTCH